MTTKPRGLSRALNPKLESMPAATRFLGKQPILDKKMKVYGHELLFRAGLTNAFSGDEEEATRQVIDSCLLLSPDAEMGKNFVNCTKSALTSGIVTLLSPSNTVLEILETVEPDPELLECCRALKARGYHFALDDFSPQLSKLPLLEFADYIKVDFRLSDVDTRRQIYELTRGRGVTFIAEKVETAEDLQAAQREGCSLFQGYYFCKPNVTQSRVIPQNHLIHLQLLTCLSQSPANLAMVEQLVMADSAICYRLLRLVNSAWYGLPSTITSIRGALVLVGDDEMRNLVTVALASSFVGTSSHALLSFALERAKFCELLAPVLNKPAPKLYLLGMLSIMDAFLGLPMDRVVQSLPVDYEMKAALLGEVGPLSTALKIAHRQQTGDTATSGDLHESSELTTGAVSKMHLQSVHWADMVMRG